MGARSACCADSPARYARSRRFRRLGASNAAVWRAVLQASAYADLLPRLELGAQLSPLVAVSRLLSRRCAYCSGPGEYWFTLQSRRVCRECFELDIQNGVATRTEFPRTELQDFLVDPTPAAAGDDAAAAAGAPAAATVAAAAPAAPAAEDAGAAAPAGGAPAAAAAATTGPHRPPLCTYISKSFAKTLFCLGDKELSAMRSLTLVGEDVKRTGIGMGTDTKITLVTAGDCLDAAVARYGSQAGLLAEAAARRAKAQAASDAKVAAGKGCTLSPYLKQTINFPGLNQSRHSVFSTQAGFGLVYAVRSPFLAAAGGRRLRVAVPGSAEAADADFVSFVEAVRAAKSGDVVQLLPGRHLVDDDEEDDDGRGAYIDQAITILGRSSFDEVRPTLAGSRRALCIISSCALRGLRIDSLQRSNAGDFMGFYPTVLVCNVFAPKSNRDLVVCVQDVDMVSPFSMNPHSFALLLNVQHGAPAGRTLVELTRCVAGRMRRCETAELVVDASSDVGPITIHEQEE